MLVGIDASRSFRLQRTGTERYSAAITRHLLQLPRYKMTKNRLPLLLRYSLILLLGCFSPFLASADPSVPAVVGAQLTDELLIGYFDFVAAARRRAALVDQDGDADSDADRDPDLDLER